MSLTLSATLLTKAVVLNSMTIDSPTERVNKDGVPIRPTIYFDKPATKDGKLVPSKKSTIYTPNADEAAKLGATVDIVETIKIDGVQSRFLKSTLDTVLLQEVKSVKGMLKANVTIKAIRKAVKAATSAYIMSLPMESRNMIADSIAQLVSPAPETLNNTGNSDDEVHDRV